jgi:hypothetical protein
MTAWIQDQLRRQSVEQERDEWKRQANEQARTILDLREALDRTDNLREIARKALAALDRVQDQADALADNLAVVIDERDDYRNVLFSLVEAFEEMNFPLMAAEMREVLKRYE